MACYALSISQHLPKFLRRYAHCKYLEVDTSEHPSRREFSDKFTSYFIRYVLLFLHRHNVGLEGGGANAPPVFFLPKNRVLATELKRGI
jgi:hypothetical protein